MNDKLKNQEDIKYMKMALALAEKGRGMTNPNPMVGAVIVKEGRVIGKGFHEEYGGSHAEPNAIKNSTESPEDATIYVNLEPCCHTGKTPPCTDAIIKSGIGRVVVGTKDPNPKVGGGGIEILRKKGIEVEEGILKDECEEINSVFFHYIKTGLPCVTMKYAMTADGKTAGSTGDSKWITGDIAREHVHIQRSYNSAIMVGKGTVIADNPLLTSRTEKGTGRNPVRIICDTNLSISLTSNVVKTAQSVSTIIAASCNDEKKIKQFTDAGCRVINVDKKNNRIDLIQLMKLLGKEGIDSILFEGGSVLAWEMLKCGLVSKVQAYIAPKLFGGITSRSPVGGEGILLPENCAMLGEFRATKLGEDILLESEVKTCLRE